MIHQIRLEDQGAQHVLFEAHDIYIKLILFIRKTKGYLGVGYSRIDDAKKNSMKRRELMS